MKDKIKILIVEDDIFTAERIELKLIKIGYTNIAIAMSYQQAMASIKEEIPDLILLDLHLKDGYRGIDIATEKEVFNKVAIIYITSDTDSQTLKTLQATNPKSYLSKPLKEEELEFHVSSVLKHIDKRKLIPLGYNFSYDLEKEILFFKNEPCPQKEQPTKKERVLLELLIHEKGKFITSERLESIIWANKPTSSTSSLRTLVLNLRKKLNPKMIVNTPYDGYKLDI